MESKPNIQPMHNGYKRPRFDFRAFEQLIDSALEEPTPEAPEAVVEPVDPSQI